MFPQTTRTLSVSSDVGVLGTIPALQQPGTETDTEASGDVEGLNHQHEGSLAELGHHLLIDHVQSRLVDQTDVDTFFLQVLNGIEGPVEGISEIFFFNDVFFLFYLHQTYLVSSSHFSESNYTAAQHITKSETFPQSFISI